MFLTVINTFIGFTDDFNSELNRINRQVTGCICNDIVIRRYRSADNSVFRCCLGCTDLCLLTVICNRINRMSALQTFNLKILAGCVKALQRLTVINLFKVFGSQCEFCLVVQLQLQRISCPDIEGLAGCLTVLRDSVEYPAAQTCVRIETFTNLHRLCFFFHTRNRIAVHIQIFDRHFGCFVCAVVEGNDIFTCSQRIFDGIFFRIVIIITVSFRNDILVNRSSCFNNTDGITCHCLLCRLCNLEFRITVLINVINFISNGCRFIGIVEYQLIGADLQGDFLGACINDHLLGSRCLNGDHIAYF